MMKRPMTRMVTKVLQSIMYSAALFRFMTYGLDFGTQSLLVGWDFYFRKRFYRHQAACLKLKQAAEGRLT